MVPALMLIEGRMRTFLQWSLFPLILGTTIFVTRSLISAGKTPAMASTSVGFALLFLIWILEQLIPFQLAWNRRDPQRRNDLGHMLIGTGIGGGAGEMILKLAFIPVGFWLAEKLHGRLWPDALPKGLQIALVYVLADLGRYWQHRLHHRSGFLWKFHALHHSADQMNVFKTTRSHPVERLLQQVFMFGLLGLLGAPSEVVMWYVIPNSFLGMLDHSNLDVRLGMLEWIVMGPNGHRVHHARDGAMSQKNFGSAIVLWDILFGTFEAPTSRKKVTAVGIEGEPFPASFTKQLLCRHNG